MGKLRALRSRLSGPPSRIAYAPKTADPFYLSTEWRNFRARRRLDPDYYEAKRRAKPGEWLILDHVHERKDGGDDFGLTEWLTASEHQAKTARARAQRALGGAAAGGRSKV